MILEGRNIALEEKVLCAGRALCLLFLIAAITGFIAGGAEVVLRATFVYLFLLLIFRIAGRRSLTESTTTDLVLLLIISETVQGALVKSDDTLMTAMLLVVTLVTLETFFLVLKLRIPFLDRLVEGKPVRIMKDSVLDRNTMKILRVEEEDIIESARRNNEIRSIDEVSEAIVEKNGDITVLPKS